MAPNPFPTVDELASPAPPASKIKKIASRTATTNTATTSSTFDTTDAIPSKFLVSPQMFLRQDFDGFRQPSSHRSGFATSTVGNEIVDWRVLHPTAKPTTRATQPSPDTLLNVPGWFIHAFAGVATFVLIVAVVLYLAQFPPGFNLVSNTKRKFQGYTNIQQEDYELDAHSHHGRSFAVAPTRNDFEHHGESGTISSLSKRKPRHPRVNTAAEYRGLGIAVPGDKRARSQPHNRSSYDEEALRRPPKSPAVTAWDALTAPLPSTTTFGNGTGTLYPPLPSSRYHEQADIESGRRRVSSLLSVSTPDLFDVTSPYHQSVEAAPGSAFLRKVNDGVYYAADKLSKTFYDKVSGPEDGLLLPVSNVERERQLTPRVFVG